MFPESKVVHYFTITLPLKHTFVRGFKSDSIFFSDSYFDWMGITNVCSAWDRLWFIGGATPSLAETSLFVYLLTLFFIVCWFVYVFVHGLFICLRFISWFVYLFTFKFIVFFKLHFYWAFILYLGSTVHIWSNEIHKRQLLVFSNFS